VECYVCGNKNLFVLGFVNGIIIYIKCADNGKAPYRIFEEISAEFLLRLLILKL